MTVYKSSNRTVRKEVARVLTLNISRFRRQENLLAGVDDACHGHIRKFISEAISIVREIFTPFHLYTTSDHLFRSYVTFAGEGDSVF